MNDWDRRYKEAAPYADMEQEAETEPEESFRMPEGFTPVFFPEDSYGKYGRDAEGKLVLLVVDASDAREAYSVQEGCAAIAADAFSEQPRLSALRIPASLREIPEGALSNSGSWADAEKGICRVDPDPANPVFFADEWGFYQKLPEGSVKLLLAFLEEKQGTARIGSAVSRIGDKAFYGRPVKKVCFQAENTVYTFPSHAYFREVLLDSFGKNGKLYDFAQYDAFLLRSHFNGERLRMLCDRLTQPTDLSEEMRGRLLAHVRDNIPAVMEALQKEYAAAELLYLLEAGVFTEECVTQAIEIVNQSDRRELLTYLMDYRHEHFAPAEFDFSI